MRIHRAILVLGTLLSLVGAAAAQPSTPTRPAPKLGLMLNDDGDRSAPSDDPAKATRLLHQAVDSLKGTRVRTLVWCVGCGSDVLYYPTKVASPVGWRASQRRVGNLVRARKLLDAKVDTIRVVGQRAKELGLNFVPSYRMNDVHFARDALTGPLTGEFWMKNRNRFTLAVALGKQQPPDSGISNLLDYSHDEVRAYRLGVIRELIERYGDLLDGIELDFMRHCIFYPHGAGRDRPRLITAMVEEVRRRLDELAKAGGREVSLVVRLPPTLDACHWAGLAADDWVRRRLVDVVVLSQVYSLAQELPAEPFVELARRTGAQVYVGVLPRCQFTNSYPFVAQPTEATYRTAQVVGPSVELVRAAVVNYRKMGVAGYEMYNLSIPLGEFARAVEATLGDPEQAGKRDRVFAITSAAVALWGQKSERQLPRAMQARAEKFSLYLGEDLSTAGPRHVGLRLGFNGLKKTDQVGITINGKEVYSGAAERLVPVHGQAGKTVAFPALPQAYLQVGIDDRAVLRAGANEVTVHVSTADERHGVELIDLQLGVLAK